MNPKLELGEILNLAFRDVWDGRGDFLALAAMPVVILAIFSGVLTLFAGPIMLPEPVVQSDDPAQVPAVAGGVLARLLAETGAQFALTALFAVAWHRRYLVPSETPTALHAVKWEPRKARYLFRLIGIFLAAILVSIPAALLGGILGGGNQALILAVVIGVSIPVICRLTLSLPAVAVDDDPSFGRAWALGKGSTLQLMGLVILPVAMTQIAVVLVVQPLIGVMAGFGVAASVTGHFLATLLAGAVGFAGFAVLTTGLSEAYLRLTRQTPAAATV